MRALVLAGALLAACGGGTPAGGGAGWGSPAPAPPADAAFLELYGRSYGFRLGRPSALAPTPDGDAVLFLRSGPESFERDLYAFDLASGEERVLLTAQAILRGAEERLSAEERARRERMRLVAGGIASFSLSKDGRRILAPVSGRLFVVERASGQVKELAGAGGFPVDPRFSPDGNLVACVRDGDLYVMAIDSGVERRLTTGAGDTLEHGVAEFVAQEEMGRYEGYWFSPDSRAVAYQETDTSEVELLQVADPAHPEVPPSAFRYPRAGRANARVRLGIVPVGGGATTWVSWDAERHPYLAKVVWKEEAAPLTILVQNRAQTEEILLAVDPATGATRELLVERDPEWLNLDGDVPRWLPDGHSFLWTTERGGAWQLERRDREGRLLGTLTALDFGYRGLEDVDPEAGTALVRASADPTQAQLWRVPLDRSRGAPERLTQDAGEHFAVVSEDHGTRVRVSATRDAPERFVVERADGRVAGELRSVAAQPPFEPRVEWTAVGDRGFHAVLVRPREFRPDARYPVVVSVYGGPLARVVGSAPREYLLEQWLADRGFVVVSLDGRGTPGRGREWERALRGRIGEIPLEDQVAGLQALGARYPELDLSRVGIFGWSFGGYLSALAVLLRPDVFHAAVAGAPVADWRDYDTHYTERYLGLPDERAADYDRASLLTHAPALRRPLLLIHGTADDNVLFTHSVRLSDALFRAGRRHEFLPLAGLTHMVPDPIVTTRLYGRIAEFLVAHLGAAEARSEGGRPPPAGAVRRAPSADRPPGV
jgi:dipeptidyl-peptidase-4